MSVYLMLIEGHSFRCRYYRFDNKEILRLCQPLYEQPLSNFLQASYRTVLFLAARTIYPYI